MIPQEAVATAKKLHELILASPDDAVSLIASMIVQIHMAADEYSRCSSGEEAHMAVDAALTSFRHKLAQNMAASVDAEGNVWLYGAKVFRRGDSPQGIAYQLRGSVFDAIYGRPPLVPLDQVPPNVPLPPGDTSMISMTQDP